MFRWKEVLAISSALGLAAATMCAMMLFLAGCATPPPAPVEETKALVWPPAPEVARIRFVRNIASEEDLKAEKSFGQNLAAFLTGEKLPEGRVAQPMGLVASDDTERLYVSDAMQNVVFVFDFKNKKLSQIKQSDTPGGIALDAQENLYVVQTAKKSIAVFGRDGKQSHEYPDPELARPLGLAIDKGNGKIYVVDTGDDDSGHDVKIYDMNGKRIGKIGGTKGGDPSQFSYPTFATVDDKGNLYVADSLNGRVQKFDANGKFLDVFGQTGSAWGEFDKPKGLAVDSFGNLYVVDSGWSNVQIFNPKGQILLFFGGRGPLPGMMKNPISLTIDKQNRIYVGDYLNHRIGVYELVNTKPDDSFLNPPPNPKGKK